MTGTTCSRCGGAIPLGKVLTFEIPVPHPAKDDLTMEIDVGPCCEHEPKGSLNTAPLWTVEVTR